MSVKFSPTPAELALVSQIFAQADPQKLGILTGDVAVRVFGGAKLQPTVLGEIWSIADEDNNGWLPKKGVAIAVRLMGWAQKGEKVTQALINTPGPLPTIEGVTAVAQHHTGMSTPRSPPPGLPPFTPQDRTKFQGLFMKSGPTNGLLSGEKARDFFVKSGLSNEKLLQIWNLADTQDRGALDSTDFALGMYFIQGLMSGQLSFIPSTLPPGLYQQAGGNPASNQDSVRSHMSGNSGSFSPLSSAFPHNRNNIQPQYTGQSPLVQPEHTGFSTPQSRPPVLPARPSSSALGAVPFVPQRNGHIPQWDVTPAEKANADRLFDELDTRKRGYIEGDVAVPFMLKSNLPGEDLAQVWDLADISNDGRLTRDGFAVAMYLIQKKLAGVGIPATLPPSLVPPSLRNNSFSTQQPEAARDLLWDDTPPASAAPQLSHQTGIASSTISSSPVPASASRDPFGSSAFGSMPHHDLLGDDDDVGANSPPLHDQSVEIGNVQNQLSSTNRSLDSAKNERATVEQTLADQAAQLSALQTQLSSAKATYETETKLLAALRERHSGQMADIQKSREELIRAESDLSAVRVEKAEVEGAFLRDKEEARELHRRMVETGQQVEALRSDVEKAKKDAKQQKGLLAIARKQLSTKEAEKAKVTRELEEASADVASINKEKENTEAGIAKHSADSHHDVQFGLSPDSLTFAASQALPVSPDPSSPAGSATGKSNNPFERLAMSSGNATPRSQSPFLPFAGSSVPTPSVGTNGTSTEAPSDTPTQDPFGFQAPTDHGAHTTRDVLQTSDSAVVGSNVSTPRAVPVDIAAFNGSHSDFESALSPTPTEGSDHFVTPPTSANIQHSQTHDPPPLTQSTKEAAQFPALDPVASHIPDIEAERSIPGQFPEERHVETDLSAELKELEAEESDSDSDSDDGIPLAELAKLKSQETSPPPPAQGNANAQADVPNVSFDDIFGVTPPTAVTIPPSAGVGFQSKAESSMTSGPFDSSSKDFGSTVKDIAPQPEAPTVAGVNAFDEAMGKIPNTVSPSVQRFTFDSAFDDNFDFPAATGKSPPPPATVADGNKTDGSDSVFVAPSRSGAAPSIPSYTQPATFPSLVSSPPKAETKTTFDEAFSGFDSNPVLDLNNSFSSPLSNVPASSAISTDSPAQDAFSASSPVAVSPQPGSSPSRIANRPISPSPKGKSPPRVSSPKPRVSTSSREAPEKLKEPATRHSKLSIRLPFGKKKKQQQESIPISPAQHLTPPQEESMRTVSPAVEDDVEAVKQLTAMGFSRTQAVSALEKCGYDVQKALNSLLGAP